MFNASSMNTEEIMNLEPPVYFTEPAENIELVILHYKELKTSNDVAYLKVNYKDVVSRKVVSKSYFDDPPSESNGSVRKGGRYEFKQLLKAIGIALEAQDGNFRVPDTFTLEQIKGKKFIADVVYQNEADKKYMKIIRERPKPSGLSIPDLEPTPPPFTDSPEEVSF